MFFYWTLLLLVVASNSFFPSSLIRNKRFHLQSTSSSSIPPPLIEYKRRVRYSGSHPKQYSEKYKELRYDAEVIEKVTSKGSTPAGNHIPIMVEECLEYLNLSLGKDIKQGTIVLDCTLGGGGHTSAILKQLLGKNATVHAIDQDLDTLENTRVKINQTFYNSSFHFHHMNFGQILEMVEKENIVGQVDAVLAGRNQSTYQISNLIIVIKI